MAIFVSVLILLMIISALIALETDFLLSSIISLGAIGLLLSLAFLLLGAVEIAVTQIVVEVLLLIILIRATLRRDFRIQNGHRERFGMLLAVILIIALVTFGIQMFQEFSSFGSGVLDRIPDAPAVTYLAQGWQKTGASNIISAVILDFRAWDTLGGVAVLFCAVLGALAVLRRKAHKRLKDKDQDVDAA